MVGWVRRGATVTTNVAMAHTVHRSERSSECLDGAIAEAHGDRQIVLTTDHIGCGDGHPPSADIFRHRHPRQRREHPAQVVARRSERCGECLDVDVVGETMVDLIDQAVEVLDHGRLLRIPLSSE